METAKLESLKDSAKLVLKSSDRTFYLSLRPCARNDDLSLGLKKT